MRVAILEKQMTEMQEIQKSMRKKQIDMLISVTQLVSSMAVLKWLVGGLLSVNLLSMVPVLIALIRNGGL